MPQEFEKVFTPDEIFGSAPPSAHQAETHIRNQSLDLIKGFAQEVWSGTVGGLMEATQAAALGGTSRLATLFGGEAGAMERMAAARDLATPFVPTAQVIAEGLVAQGEEAANKMMGMEDGVPRPEGPNVAAGLTHAVPLVGPSVSPAVEDPTPLNIGRAVGGVVSVAAPEALAGKGMLPVRAGRRASEAVTGESAAARAGAQVADAAGDVRGGAAEAIPGVSVKVPEGFLTVGEEQGGYLKTIERTLEQTSAGRSQFAALRETQGKVMQQIADDVVGQIGKTKNRSGTVTGQDVINTLDHQRANAFEVADASYRTLKAKHGSTPVSLEGVKEFAADTLDRMGATKELIGETGGDLGRILEAIVKNPNDTYGFKELMDVRSTLLKQTRKLKEQDFRGGTIKKLVSEIDDALEVAAKEGGFEADWRMANKQWKDAVETYDRSLLGTIRRMKNPEAVSRFVAKDLASPEGLALAKKTLPAKTWDRVKAQVLQDAVEKASVRTPHANVSSSYLKNWWNRLGDEKVAVLFSKEEQAAISRVIELSDKISPTTGGIGAFFEKVMTYPVVGQATKLAVAAGTGGLAGSIGGAAAGTAVAGTVLYGQARVGRALANILANPAKAKRMGIIMQDLKNAGMKIGKGSINFERGHFAWSSARFAALKREIDNELEDMDNDPSIKSADEIFPVQTPDEIFSE